MSEHVERFLLVRIVEFGRTSAFWTGSIALVAVVLDFAGRCNGLPDSVPLLTLAGVALGALASHAVPYRTVGPGRAAAPAAPGPHQSGPH